MKREPRERTAIETAEQHARDQCDPRAELRAALDDPCCAPERITDCANRLLSHDQRRRCEAVGQPFDPSGSRTFAKVLWDDSGPGTTSFEAHAHKYARMVFAITGRPVEGQR